MSETVLCRILAVGLGVCLLILALWAVYFVRQWKKMDRMLDEFEKWRINLTGHQNEKWLVAGKDNQDVQETRESKMVSRLQQILINASYRESYAEKEKNQVMALISDLSHQLKTPLANIVMNMEILDDETLDETSRKEFIQRTAQQAGKMQWLMQNLIKASRLENGIIDFKAENAGIKNTIARSVSAVYAQASKKQMEICLDDFEDCQLYHNPKWTAEALGNILENAIKYSPEGSCIRIGLNRMDIYTSITIADQGMGICESEYHKIFKRFYRGEKAEQAEGSGLGLYLSQLILQSEKGYITVASKEGQGSCFSVFLLNSV